MNDPTLAVEMQLMAAAPHDNDDDDAPLLPTTHEMPSTTYGSFSAHSDEAPTTPYISFFEKHRVQLMQPTLNRTQVAYDLMGAAAFLFSLLGSGVFACFDKPSADDDVLSPVFILVDFIFMMLAAHLQKMFSVFEHYHAWSDIRAYTMTELLKMENANDSCAVTLLHPLPKDARKLFAHRQPRTLSYWDAEFEIFAALAIAETAGYLANDGLNYLTTQATRVTYYILIRLLFVGITNSVTAVTNGWRLRLLKNEANDVIRLRAGGDDGMFGFQQDIEVPAGFITIDDDPEDHRTRSTFN